MQAGKRDPIDHLAALLTQASRVLAFTGAGISTRSNIPDFRGPDGEWRHRTPASLQDFVASAAVRREYWAWKRDAYAKFRDASPNPGHEALVTLEHLGKLEAVVTQNVDGLHRMAGTAPERLVELHGSNAEAVCMGCAARLPISRAFERFEASGEPPHCDGCGGMLKPAVIMFGQTLDPDTFERAQAHARNADLALALGSSLLVTPAAHIPLIVARNRMPYVIVNQGATPHDPVATLVIDGDVSDVLPAAVALLFG
jgi:NAD-dependent deacetylase